MATKTNKNSKTNKSAPKNKETVEKVDEAPIAAEENAVEEPVRHEWSNGKYAACKECGETTHKHYSGGSCTRCYTERRNKRLGLGKYNPEMARRKAERVEVRINRMEAKLAELKAQRDELYSAAS